MFSKAGESKLVREIIFPLAERVVDAAFVSTALILPVAIVAAVALIAAGRPGYAGLAGLLAMASAAGVHARFIAPRQLRVVHLDLGLASARGAHESAAPRPARVVFVSDLHLGRFKQAAWAQRVVDAVNAQSPDMVLIGGDFIGHPGAHSIPDMLAPLAQLKAGSKLAVLGNHDYGVPGVNRADDIARILGGLGITLLKNQCVTIDRRLRVVGLDELWAGRADIPAALAQCAPADADSPIVAGARTLVLGHNPDVLIGLSPQVVPQPSATAWLFGHTHGGQIYLPFAPGLGVPISSSFYRGSFDTPHGRVYVSSGCGEAATPTRLGTRPEIVVFDV